MYGVSLAPLKLKQMIINLFLQSPRANICMHSLSSAFVLRTIPVSVSLALFSEPHFWAGPIVVGVYSTMETECRTLTRIYKNSAIRTNSSGKSAPYFITQRGDIEVFASSSSSLVSVIIRMQDRSKTAGWSLHPQHTKFVHRYRDIVEHNQVKKKKN